MKDETNFDIKKMSQDLKMSEDQIQLYLVDMPRIERASGIPGIKKAFEDATSEEAKIIAMEKWIKLTKTVPEIKEAFENAPTKETKIVAMKKWIELTKTIPEIQEAFATVFLLNAKTSKIATDKWEKLSSKEIESSTTPEEADKAGDEAPKGELKMVAFKKKVSLINSAAVAKTLFEDISNGPKNTDKDRADKILIVSDRWNQLSLKDAKALEKSSSLLSIKCVLENAGSCSEAGTIALKKMGKKISREIRSICRTGDAEYLFRYSIYFSEKRKKIIKKWAYLITFTAQAKHFHEITHSEVSLQIWGELSLNDAKLASTENELKSVLEKVPPKSEAEILATKKIAKFYGY